MIPTLIISLLVIVGGYWVLFSPYSQFFGSFPYRHKTSQKVVALTFDDGPNEPFTSELLTILKHKEVLATFFVVGKNVQKYPGVLKKIYANGHTVGNHSLNHQFSHYLNHPGFRTEIEATQAIIAQAIGKTPHLFRPPWLFRTPMLFHMVKKLGLKPVSGEFCHSREVSQIPAERIAKATLSKIKPGAIIIFHDGYDAKGGNRSQTVKAVELVIDSLQEQGYAFTTVDKLLDIPAYQ